MNLRSRVVGSIMWTLAGGGTQIILKLIVVAILARLLSPAEFGTVAGAMLVVYILELVGSLGVGPSIVQRKELTKEHIAMAHLITLVSSAFFATGLIIFAEPIAHLWNLEGVSTVLQVMGGLLVIRGIGLPAKYRLERELAYRQVALAQITAYSVGYGGVGVTLALSGFGLWALVAALLAEATTHTLVLLWLRRPAACGPLTSRHFVELAKFGVGVSGANALSQFSLKIDEYIVAVSGDALALGLYSRAKTTGFMPINRITGAASSVLFAAFSSIQDERTRVGRGLRRTLVFYSMILMPGIAILALLGPEVILVLLGDQWGAAVVPFQILACALFLRGLTRFSNVVIISFGRSGILAIQQSIFAVVMLITCWVGSRYGLAGVATGVFVATLLQVALTFSISLRLIGWHAWPFVVAIAQAVALGSICAILGAAAVTGARYFDLTSLYVIAAAGLGLTIGGLIVLLLCPLKWMGVDGIWIFDVIGKSVIAKLPFLRPIGNRLLHRFQSTSQKPALKE